MRLFALAASLLLVPAFDAQLPPASGPAPQGNAHFASDGIRLLDETALQGPPIALNAAMDHIITVTLARHPLLDESSIRLLYTIDGEDPATGRVTQMHRDGATNAGDLRFAAILHPGDLAAAQDESLVRFLIKYRIGTERTDAGAQGQGYHYLRDPEAPRIQAPRLNGQDSLRLRPTTPLHVEAAITDLGGVAGARVEVLDRFSIVLTHELQARNGFYTLDLPSGPALPEGIYDVRIQAWDHAGNQADPVLAARTLNVDATPPRAEEVTLNGVSVLQATPATPIEILARIPDRDAVRLRAEFLDGGGQVVRVLDFTPLDASLWRANLPAGAQLQDGGYHLRTTTEDEAGNTGQSSTAYPVLVMDTQPPTIHLADVEYAQGSKQAARRGDQVALLVQVSDANPVQTVYTQTPAGPLALTPLGGGQYRHEFTAPTTTGKMSVPVTAVDGAGNTAQRSVEALIDNEAPLLHDIAAEPTLIAPGDTLHITVTATDQATMVQRILLDASKLNPATGTVDLVHAPGSTLWEARIPVLAPGGSYVLPVVAFDQAGNQADRVLRVQVREAGAAILQVLVDGREQAYTRSTATLNVEVRVAGADESTLNLTLAKPGSQPIHVLLSRATDNSFTGTLHAPPEGRYRLLATLTQSNGRSVSLDDADGRLVVDDTPPRLRDLAIDTGFAPSANRSRAVSDEPVTLRAAWQDASPLQVTVTDISRAGNTTQHLLGQDESYAGVLRLHGAGRHVLRVVARDAVGFTTEALRDIDVMADAATGPAPSPPPQTPTDPAPSPTPPASPPTTSPASPASSMPVLSSSGIASGNASNLTWSIQGTGAACVQVQTSINGQPYQDIEACSTQGKTSKLASIAGAGDAVRVRGRVRLAGNTTGPWQELATYTVSQPNAAVQPIRLEAPANNGTVRAQAWIYDANGHLLSKLPLNATGGSFTGAYQPTKVGSYRIEYHLEDSNGHTRTLETQATATTTAEPKNASSAPMLLLLAALPLLALAGLALWRRRSKHAKAPPPKPASAPKRKASPATPAPPGDGKPADQPEPPPTAADSAPPPEQRRVLASQDMATVGPAGIRRLFGGRA